MNYTTNFYAAALSLTFPSAQSASLATSSTVAWLYSSSSTTSPYFGVTGIVSDPVNQRDYLSING